MKNRFHVFLNIFFLLAFFATSAAFAVTIDLSTATPNDGVIEVNNGDVLTGTLDGSTRPYKVSIADGATVTLQNATVNGVHGEDYMWAGLTCEGDCKIILAEGTTNTVNGFHYNYPGIYVPKEKTLTIDGSGELFASTNSDEQGWRYAAGIGGGADMSCGNIVINNGIINAIGGEIGIGAGTVNNPEGVFTCGNITISGGTVTATVSEQSAGAGIGTGYNYGSLTMGNITISGGTVTATVGEHGNGAGIGAGMNLGSLTMGDISISGGIVTATVGEYGYGAGIGTGYNNGSFTTMGDITISGGIVTATVGEYGNGAGIGTGYNHSSITIDDITIRGGSVTATGTGAGIGIGYNQGTVTCAGITISDKVSSLIAVKGDHAVHSIGIGFNDPSYDATFSCDKINIGGEETNFIETSPFIFPKRTYTVAFDGNGGSGSMESQKLASGDVLQANTFTRQGYVFVGWNTAKDGSGMSFGDGAKVLQFLGTNTNVTFYAQWWERNFSNVVDLAGLTGDYVAKRGDILTGTLKGNYMISIADGAIVELNGVTIDGIHGEDYMWAGLTCKGNCTIVLAEGTTNTVKGFYYDYPGIYVPEGSTLTIEGSGFLKASSNGWGAGIGGGYQISCGNIVIKGGTVTATGGKSASGIGGGGYASCGNIIITNGVTKVTAIKGENAPYSIGKWKNGIVGTITIGGVVIENGVETSPFTYPTIVTLSDLKGDYVANGGEVLTGTLEGNYKVSIADGATVTLRGVTIDGTHGEDYMWAGLTCEGDCKIELAEGTTNTVKGFHNYYPGVYVPVGKTLTIEGLGTLVASSGTDANGLGYGAGIGGGRDISCGNIVIDGGIVTATGGIGNGSDKYGAAGIGLGASVTAALTSGDITINGSTVTATGGVAAAGIGLADNYIKATGGKITINGGSVTATSGEYGAGIGIGASNKNAVVTSGAITIRGGSVTAKSDDFGTGIGLGFNEGTTTFNGGITITNHVIEVVAIKGANASHSIGIGSERYGTFTSGKIIIGIEEKNFIKTSPFIFSARPYTVAFDGNEGSGSMENQVLYLGDVLPANTFTRQGYVFAGWNTAKDGSGMFYKDGAEVLEFPETSGNVTLYAQWWDGTFSNVVDLAGLTGDYVADRGDILTGTLGGNYKVSIADKATVMLKNATIQGPQDATGEWAGITCEGDCKIELAEGTTNTVKGFHYNYPGIYVPKGKTLTIDGSGKLFASSVSDENGYSYAAGIGGGLDMSCGNIVINNGIVNATSGAYGGDADLGAGIGAGIGTGFSDGEEVTCGNITISGGIVIATGGEGAAGIGAGLNAGSITMGDITISGGTVTATGGDDAAGIGAGYNEGSLTMGYITISGGSVTATGGDEGAGIGTGRILKSTNLGGITISGGSVTATGGYAAAGIGTGENQYSLVNLGDITINGGTVTATGGEEGAGIGTGENYIDALTVIGNITISGGTVVATGGYEGAGIGSGYSYHSKITSENITISGGSIVATGGYEGAGIGTGKNFYSEATSGNITISGGTVVATGGYEGAGIGSGFDEGVGGSASFKDITITNGVKKVTATKGRYAQHSIGIGHVFQKKNENGILTGPTIEFGDIMIGDKKKGFIYESPFVYPTPIADFAAVQIYKYDNNITRAELDGNYTGEGEASAINITDKVEVDEVDFNRIFPKRTYSTIVLPFNVNTANVSGLDAVLRYNGIGKDENNNDAIKMKVVWATSDWVKDNQIKDALGNLMTYSATDLNANTPYLIRMGDETFKVNGGVTIVPTAEAVTKIDEWEWEFRGTWKYKKWNAGDKELGYAYGFAASPYDESNIKVGDFVKVGEGAWISPMRAYLVSNNIPVQGIRANGNYVTRPSVVRKELPELMSVIVDNEDGNEKQTTVIGHFNTRTGEFKMNRSAGARTYDLKGRYVGDKANKARGAYYGKKSY